MTDTLNLDRTQVAADFREAFTGKIPQSVIDATVAELDSRPLVAGGSYEAVLTSGGITGLGLQCAIKDGETFRGSAFGVPVATSVPGWVYTADIDRLYAGTTSFAITTTPVYVALYFFDDAGDALGSFQGAGLSVTTGSGGGTGRWS